MPEVDRNSNEYRDSIRCRCCGICWSEHPTDESVAVCIRYHPDRIEAARRAVAAVANGKAGGG